MPHAARSSVRHRPEKHDEREYNTHAAAVPARQHAMRGAGHSRIFKGLPDEEVYGQQTPHCNRISGCERYENDTETDVLLEEPEAPFAFKDSMIH